MTSLPSHIEAYLTEAGFTSTEILVVKKLLESRTTTLRDLAVKTGKSTGVLDQATKKLLRKKIITREMINDGPKFILTSVDAIAKWMQDDMRSKREMLKKKHEDFESFIATLKQDQARPEMEHYEGQEGLEKAYRKLLESGEQMLCYKPIIVKEEEDPLCRFFVDFFRDRRKKGVFLRTLAQNTPLGRRYKSRDMFEYRETLLMPEDTFPFSFEKIIAGDIVACINHKEQKASFIHYPELAEVERSFFESMWKQEKCKGDPQCATTPAPDEPKIAGSTKTLSGLREFFLSRRSLAVLGVLGVLSAAITYGLYLHNYNLNLQRVREEVKAIAATGALQFDVQDLDVLQTREDISRPEYKAVIDTLNEIRNQNPKVVYAYIMRKSTDGDGLEFVADADSIDPDAVQDTNNDGILDSADENVVPGQEYEGEDSAMINGFSQPSASDKPATDQWGTWISGLAAIKNGNGDAVAIFGVDRDASDIDELAQASFAPLWTFVLIFLSFVLVRLAAFNRSLFKELLELLRNRAVMVVLLGCAVLSFLITYGLYKHNYNLNLQRIRENVKAIAATGALQFDASDLTELNSREDIYKPQYEKVIRLLNEIRSQNQEITYAYIMRGTSDPYTYKFVADADSLDPNAKKDLNKDGIVDDFDALNAPGDVYPIDETEGSFADALNGIASADTKPYTDQWGTWISASAPIKDAQGNVIAIFGIDRDARDVKELTAKTFRPFLYFLGFFFLFLLFRPTALKSSLLKEILVLLHSKTVLVLLLTCGVLSLLITYGLYRHNYNLNLQRIRENVKTIAATAASQFDAQLIETIHTKEDMTKPAFEEIVTMLKQIKNDNPSIKFSYILRLTGDGSMSKFVADAESFFAPNIDYNGDGVIDKLDVSYPGDEYDLMVNEDFLREMQATPVADEKPVEDDWGTWISGFAPIKDKNGRTVAILGIDREAKAIHDLTFQTFQAPLYFLGFFLLFLLLRSATLTPSHIMKIYKSLKR